MPKCAAERNASPARQAAKRLSSASRGFNGERETRRGRLLRAAWVERKRLVRACRAFRCRHMKRPRSARGPSFVALGDHISGSWRNAGTRRRSPRVNLRLRATMLARRSLCARHRCPTTMRARGSPFRRRIEPRRVRGMVRKNWSEKSWGGWIRTNEWRIQSPLPYHLATPQCVSEPPWRDPVCQGNRRTIRPCGTNPPSRPQLQRLGTARRRVSCRPF